MKVIKRREKRRKLNNKGFSLVECLVAMAILAVISLPILLSFSRAAETNSKARRVENATTVGSSLSEEFKQTEVTELIKKYTNYTVTDGKYVFNIDKEGANGETFNVVLTLDPTDYTDTYDDSGNLIGNTSNNVNSYSKPVYGNVSDKYNYVLREQMYAYDNEVIDELRYVYGSSYNAVSLQKTSDVYTTLTYDTTTNTYKQECKIEFKYEYYYGGGTYTVNRTLTANTTENIASADSIKNVYVFYSAINNRDIIHLHYDYPLAYTSALTGKLNYYLVDTGTTKITNSYIAMYVNGTTYNYATLGTTGTLNLSNSTGTSGPVSCYSNVTNFPGTNNGLMDNKDVDKDYLYTMTVETSFKGEVMNTISTTKTQ